MSYHAATLDLLLTQPHRSTKAIEGLDEAEQRLGVGMPPSLREWYSNTDAVAILAKHSNDDPPIPVHEFAILDTLSGPVLPIRREDQGVCTWAVALDGSDDPPVLLDDDLDGGHWRQVSPTFSAYVRACVRDYRVVVGRPALVAAQNGPVSPRAIESLRRSLIEREATFVWPGDPTYRFEGAGFGVLVWSSQDQANWFVGATDLACLVTALRLIWELDMVGPKLYDCSELGWRALARVKSDIASGDSS